VEEMCLLLVEECSHIAKMLILLKSFVACSSVRRKPSKDMIRKMENSLRKVTIRQKRRRKRSVGRKALTTA
jgi:hypothetical protein